MCFTFARLNFLPLKLLSPYTGTYYAIFFDCVRDYHGILPDSLDNYPARCSFQIDGQCPWRNSLEDDFDWQRIKGTICFLYLCNYSTYLQYLPIYLCTTLPIYLPMYLIDYLTTYLPLYLITHLSTYVPYQLPHFIPTYVLITYLWTLLFSYLPITVNCDS